MCRVDSSTRAFAVIGDPIEHSLSPVIHNASFQKLNLNCIYLAHRVEGESLSKALEGFKALGYGGVNVTLPHKVRALGFLKHLSAEARAIGAVNTIAFERGMPRGYNTDGKGALSSLKEEGVGLEGKKVVILGYGGAARAIAMTLALEGEVEKIVISGRSIEKARGLAGEVPPGVEVEALGLKDIGRAMEESHLLIHATPVGMKSRETLLKSSDLPSSLTVMDIVYTPLKTSLLEEAEKAGCRTIDGLGMFIHQAAEAQKIWLGIEPPVKEMRKVALGALGL